MEVWLVSCFGFFTFFFVVVFDNEHAWEQIVRSWSSGRMRLQRARPTSTGDRPYIGFPSGDLVFWGACEVDISSEDLGD